MKPFSSSEVDDGTAQHSAKYCKCLAVSDSYMYKARKSSGRLLESEIDLDSSLPELPCRPPILRLDLRLRVPLQK